MNDALFMRGFKSLGDLFSDGQRLINRDRSLLDPICQGPPFDKLQNQCLLALGLFQSVDVSDVGMVERRQNFGFALEPCEAIRIIRERLRQYLQGHVPVELGISGSIHLPHAALADEGGDIVVAESGADL